ncbi:hypothetical protein V5O48_004287 [Marasmius crinis-equi]|uniref:C2 domain-containing protein n=1 Tax=Marasmius crinis-equi TaxID=585013 RepID=A0ABR3FRE3_9AGAR
MSRTSSSTEASNTPSISPASSTLRVQFDSPTSEVAKRFLQFHVISAGLSEKASGKRPASSFVVMSYGNGKNNYTTSTVNCKDSDPVWHDNLGPLWLKEDVKITFRLRHRSLPLVPAQTVATTKTFTVRELIEQQKDLYDLNSTIKLPLEFTSASPPPSPKRSKPAATTPQNTKYLILNLRLPSSTETASEEVAKARARSNSVLLEQQQAAATTLPPSSQGLTLKTSDIDSGEDLRLAIDRKAALEMHGEPEQVVETISIIPRITCTSPN